MEAKAQVYLGIDSASSYLALALWSQDGILAEFCESVGRDHAKRIITELDTLLNRSGIKRRELKGIGVGIGPGSYTGLRVGVATAKGLAKGLSIPVQGGSSLAAIAARQLSEAQPRGVITLDARRGNVYAGVFFQRGNMVKPETEVMKLPKEVLQERYPALPFFEDAAPDAGYLARQALIPDKGPLTPLYL